MAKIKLLSSDGETLEVDSRVAARMMKIENFYGGECAGKVFPVPEVRGEILDLVIRFCEKKAEFDENADNIDRCSVEQNRKTWNREFLYVRQCVLIDLILASQSMQIRELLDRSCEALARITKGKSQAELRVLFNIRR